jgi:NAD+ synthase (glutamine-hydrolysing)
VVRVALGQLNTTVGDLGGNVARLSEWTERATLAGADLICVPELAITGYPPEDLVLRPEFVRDNLAALEDLAAATEPACAVVVGFVDMTDAGLHNAAALLRGGAVEERYHKMQLPNFGVFDEKRYFVPGTAACSVRLASSALGLSICEDAWHPDAPFDAYARSRPRAILNINGSPYHRHKGAERLEICRARAAETGAYIVYVNAVGGQDELVFDGGSMVIAPSGDIVGRGAMFEEDLLVVDIDDESAHADRDAAWPDAIEEVYRALVLGLGDYVRKNGFGEVVVGMSGGIDSALVAVLATDALGAAGVRALAMPSKYSSVESVEDAVACADRLGIRIDTVPIGELFDAYRRTLREVFDGHPGGVAEENLQARIRGNLLMALSNAFGSMVLATGNKSEYAVGYATLYGDMAGGFAPIKDVPKTLVYQLARRRNAAATGESPIPERVLTKPPTAELRPGQLDTDSLPPYSELDPIIELYVEDDLGVDEIVRAGHDRATVERVAAMIDRAEYKRRQAPPGLKITPKAFGRDRRMPITNRFTARGETVRSTRDVP